MDNFSKYASPTWVRLDELADRLKRKASDEKVKPSRIIRRAIRAYLDNKNYENMEELAQELKAIRSDFARVGGNLNQIALYFNMNDKVKHNELAKSHEDLQVKFGKLKDLLLVVKGATERE